jgi:hypothetical protein
VRIYKKTLYLIEQKSNLVKLSQQQLVEFFDDYSTLLKIFSTNRTLSLQKVGGKHNSESHKGIIFERRDI